MNNKGFTLIEIIIVIAILGTLGVLITLNLSNTLNNAKDDECNSFVEEIERTACVYVGLSNKKIECTREKCEPVTLKLLIEEGMIDEGINPCTKEDIDLNDTVTVSWNDEGEKVCKYNGVR